MAEPLPMPAGANGMAERALDPTEVIPAPQPLQCKAADRARVISGQVIGGRHRARRVRRPGPGSVGAVVLSATGAVAGLSLLMPHGDSSDDTARSQQPPRSTTDDAAGRSANPVAPAEATRAGGDRSAAAASSQPAGTPGTTTTSVTRASARGWPTAAGARHARTSGTWDSGDWQEAVGRAAAAQRSSGKDRPGRHRAGDWAVQPYGAGQ